MRGIPPSEYTEEDEGSEGDFEVPPLRRVRPVRDLSPPPSPVLRGRSGPGPRRAAYMRGQSPGFDSGDEGGGGRPMGRPMGGPMGMGMGRGGGGMGMGGMGMERPYSAPAGMGMGMPGMGGGPPPYGAGGMGMGGGMPIGGMGPGGPPNPGMYGPMPGVMPPGQAMGGNPYAGGYPYGNGPPQPGGPQQPPPQPQQPPVPRRSTTPHGVARVGHGPYVPGKINADRQNHEHPPSLNDMKSTHPLDSIDACICTTNCTCRKGHRVLYFEDRDGDPNSPLRGEIRYVLKDDIGKDCGDHSSCFNERGKRKGKMSAEEVARAARREAKMGWERLSGLEEGMGRLVEVLGKLGEARAGRAGDQGGGMAAGGAGQGMATPPAMQNGMAPPGIGAGPGPGQIPGGANMQQQQQQPPGIDPRLANMNQTFPPQPQYPYNAPGRAPGPPGPDISFPPMMPNRRLAPPGPLNGMDMFDEGPGGYQGMGGAYDPGMEMMFPGGIPPTGRRRSPEGGIRGGDGDAMQDMMDWGGPPPRRHTMGPPRSGRRSHRRPMQAGFGPRRRPGRHPEDFLSPRGDDDMQNRGHGFFDDDDDNGEDVWENVEDGM